MGAGEAAAQCSGVPSVPKKRRDTSQSELLGAHPRDPQEMSVPLPIQKSHISPRRAAQEGHLSQTPLLSRVHFTHTVCTGTVPTNTGLSPALHRTAGNGVQLGQTPTALGSPSLNSLPSSQPLNVRHRPRGWGFGLGSLLSPFWHCLPHTYSYRGSRSRPNPAGHGYAALLPPWPAARDPLDSMAGAAWSSLRALTRHCLQLLCPLTLLG